MHFPEKVAGYLAYAGYIRNEMPFTTADFKKLKNNNVKVTLVHGLKDKSIKTENSERLAKLMKAEGVDCELKLFDAGHGFTEEVVNYVKDWLVENKTLLNKK